MRCHILCFLPDTVGVPLGTRVCVDDQCEGQEVDVRVHQEP